MPSPAAIIRAVAALENDTEQDVYTNSTVLPYFNMALRDLQEQFQLNGIPITAQSTPVAIPMPAGTRTVSFTSSPSLPSDLIEINQLWETPINQELWIPMTKKDYLPHYYEGMEISYFRVWAWINNEIHVLPANQDNALKIDYIKSLFTEITSDTVNSDLGAQFTNIFSYLQYRTAAHCAMWIGENETRAAALTGEANTALSTSIGISVKGMQSIATRRMPFRFGFKMRNGLR